MRDIPLKNKRYFIHYLSINLVQDNSVLDTEGMFFAGGLLSGLLPI